MRTPKLSGGRRKQNRLFLALFALAFSFVGLVSASSSAGAQAAQTWSVTPAGGSPDQPGTRPDLSYTVDAGTSITDTVQVWNYGAEPIQLKVYAADALITTEGSYDLRPSTEAPTDVAAWTVLSSNAVTVAANSVIAITVKISVPKDALPGDHPGGIVASVSTPTTNAEGAQVLVEKRVGTRVNVRVNGDIVPSAAIQHVSVIYSGSLNPIAPGSVKVNYTFANTGNTRLSGSMHLELSGLVGSKSVDLPDVPVTMPGNTLVQSFDVDDVWPTGPITAKITFIPKEDAGIPDIQTIASAAGSGSTFALPFAQLFAIILIAGLLVLLVRYRKARFAQLVAAAAASTPSAPPTAENESTPVG